MGAREFCFRVWGIQPEEKADSAGRQGERPACILKKLEGKRLIMDKKRSAYEIGSAELETVSGGSYTAGIYRKEALAFLKSCMDARTFDRIMSTEEGHRRPYVAAKIFLSGSDWDKYIWIEYHGSLDGYPG